MGKGKTSTVMAIIAPTSAMIGLEGRKSTPARKAKNKPANEPSQLFPLLKGKLLEAKPPKSDAVLSPKQNIPIAA